MNGFGFNPSPEKQLNLGLDPESFFHNFFPQGTKTVTGLAYSHIFQAGMEAGFTDKELKEYMAKHGIEINSKRPPEDESGVQIRLT